MSFCLMGDAFWCRQGDNEVVNSKHAVIWAQIFPLELRASGIYFKSVGSLLFIPSLLCTAVTSLYLSVHECRQENQRLSNNCSQESIHPAAQGGKRDLTESPDECQGYQLPSHPMTNPPSLREPWRVGGQLAHSFLLLFLVPGRDRCGSGSASDDWVTPSGSRGHGLLALGLHVCCSQGI